MLPFAVLAWESDLNLRGAIEQRYVTDFSSHQFLTGALGSLGAKAAGPRSLYQLSVSGGFFGVYALTGNASGSTSPIVLTGQLDARATWYTTRHTHLSLSTRGLIASELGSNEEDDPATLDVFAANRVQYVSAQDLRFSADVSRRTSLSIGANYSQTGTLTAAGAEPGGVDSHAFQSSFRSRFVATPVDELSAELGVRYTLYEHAIIDSQLGRGRVHSYAGTVLLSEAHDFSRNLRGIGGAGLTGAMWLSGGLPEAGAPIGAASDGGVSPEGRLEMTYTGPSYDASWGYALSFTSLGKRIGDGPTHAGWVKTSVSPLRGRTLRDLRIQGRGQLSYGIMPLKEPADGGDVGVWSALATVGTEWPIVRDIALTSGLQVDLRHMVIDAAGSGETVPPTLVRLTAIVGISGVLK